MPQVETLLVRLLESETKSFHHLISLGIGALVILDHGDQLCSASNASIVSVSNRGFRAEKSIDTAPSTEYLHINILDRVS
jgi:hypothetical protein